MPQDADQHSAEVHGSPGDSESVLNL